MAVTAIVAGASAGSVLAAVIGLFGVMMVILLAIYGGLWFQAYMSDARVSLFSLVGMSLRQVRSPVPPKKTRSKDMSVVLPWSPIRRATGLVTKLRAE